MNLEGAQWHQQWTEAPFHARLWGDFAIAAPDGADATPRGRKARALLAWLALHAGRPISRERLCGLLWGDRGEDQARASLRQTLLELKLFTSGPEPLLLVTRQSISLDPARLQTDVDALATAQGDRVLLGQILPDGDELFLGNLDDIDRGFDDWLIIERTRQRDRLETSIAAASAPAAIHRHFASKRQALATLHFAAQFGIGRLGAGSANNMRGRAHISFLQRIAEKDDHCKPAIRVAFLRRVINDWRRNVSRSQ